MASVEELKVALEVEQNKAAELAEKSLQAIDIITNQANFWLAVVSVGLAMVSIVGFGVIYSGARGVAKKVAESRLRTYIDTDEGKALVRRAVEEEVKAQLENLRFVAVHPSPDGGANGFPKDPKAASQVNE